MKRIIKLSLFFIFLTQIAFAQKSDLLKYLETIPGLTIIQKENGKNFNEFYQLELTQLLDHKNPNSKTFKQRIFLSLKDKSKPVVLVTEGYNANRAARKDYIEEITQILDANQVFVEHRYFGTSFPDSTDYDYLTIEQAANDHHRVVELLKPYFTEKWINTGISKGGQTTMYHRYYFPNDVDASVPYVGPLMFSRADPRFYHYFDTVGTSECRAAIHNYQELLLKKKKELLPKFIEGNKKAGYTYRPGYEFGYEYMVLEYAFSFWQWGADCNAIPDESVGLDSVYRYFEKIVPYGYLTEPKEREDYTFMVQAMKDFGYYGYDIKEFEGLLEVVKEHNYDFVLPENTKIIYHPELMQKVKNYLQKEGNHFLYIYGGFDPYASQQVELTGECDAVKYVLPGGSHSTRIRNFPKETREEMFKKLEEWLDIDITYEFPERQTIKR